MATEIRSLAYYASRAKKAGVAKECLSDGDYHTIIPSQINLSAAVGLWAEMYDESDALVPLEDIDLPQADYLDILDQLYNGTPFGQVQIQPQPPELPAIVHEPYFPKYIATLSGDTRTQPAVVATTDRINELLLDRGISSSPHVNGLVVGRVQSGKTRNYIGLMLKAADEGWNVIIVLTSAIKSLALQTRNRISDEFSNVGANNHQFVHELDFLSAQSHNSLAGAELDGDFLYWGVAMKEVHSLNRIKGWLETANQPVKSMRVMIIDDEADNATPDSNAGGPGNLDEEEVDERIEAIRSLQGYEELADWFDYLREQEWPDIGAKTLEARTFEKINDLLKSNKSKKAQRDEIINTTAYRHLLGMDEFVDPPVQNLVVDFYSKALGDGDDSCGSFVLLLKSILDIARERSAINSAVCTLVGPNPETGTYAYPFARCSYVAYTATPYANILNEGPSHTPIYADFIQSLDIVPQYFGVEAIFGHEVSSIEPRMPIICPIPNDEQAGILLPLRQGAVEIDNELVCKHKNTVTDWKSLKTAIAWAFCSAAVRRHLRQQISDEKKREKRDNRWTTMIVNVHHVRNIHAITRNAVQAFIEAHCGSIDWRAEFTEFCHDVWNEQTRQFTKDNFDELFNSGGEPSQDYGEISDYPTWEVVESSLHHFLEGWQQYVHAIVINSTVGGLEDQALYNQESGSMELPDDHLWIVSGGNTIGRGLTLAGLTVSYFDRVREGTCIDTLTQMGRWFGYRPGYELLPRVWMNFDAIGEMKRIAMLELRMHESMADNFKQKFSPADPAHYQQIYCWGRGLSGRARARRALDADIGTIGSTDEFFAAAEKRQHAFAVCEAFVKSLGAQTDRELGDTAGKYPYATIPLWENVDRNAVYGFIENLLPFYPDRSRKILRGLLRDMAGSEPVNWDIVIGNPNHVAETGKIGGVEVRIGAPEGLPVGSGSVIRTSSVRLHIPFYAMIRAEIINREDVEILKKYQELIAQAIENKRTKDGYLPSHYDEALPMGSDGDSIADRIALLVDSLEGQDGDKPLPEAIHARFDDVRDPLTNVSLRGFRNRSSGEYMSLIHKSAHHVRPTLQLYLIRPRGVASTEAPCINISFFWPGHAPDGFFTMCVDENPDFVRLVTPRVFCQNVEDILKEYNFPMQRKELLCKMLERLGLRCNENFFAQHINNPLDGFQYHKMEGRNAYCIDGWAENEEQRLGGELVQAAISILQRENKPIKAEDLLAMVIDEQPRFRDFFSPKSDTSEFNALMTSEVLNANDITVVSQKPKTYRYHN